MQKTVYIVTTDARTTGLGITLRQRQDDGNTKPVAYGSRYLNEIFEKIFNRRISITGGDMGVRKIRFYLYGKKVHL